VNSLSQLRSPIKLQGIEKMRHLLRTEAMGPI
jgi:hypothetical protein